mmetsp:Transcript_65002/g.149133  ORF Transcript_65002/g.149133 Transcript_65002/m.149133 type:complete len:156 (-) Transcript_65002:119-586(-)
MNMFTGMMGGGAGAPSEDDILGKFAEMQNMAARIRSIFRDPAKCTFVCVCIPEFLSVYETERLVQELSRHGIDTSNIVVNHVLFPHDHEELDNVCSRFYRTRRAMQKKYLGQIKDLYCEDFHIVPIPTQDEEVRGLELLQRFAGLLTSERALPAD